MSVQKIAIFISSRFSEFSDFRKMIAQKLNDFPHVPIHAVELNDNGADTESPSALCMSWVKRSELMVLLVGDTYGPKIHGTELSCTHIEYRTAIEDDCETRVLPFFITSPQTNDQILQSNSSLEEFKQEVMRNQRAAMYDRPTCVEEWQSLIDSVVGAIIRTVWEIRFQENGQDSSADWEIGDEVAGIPDAELMKLNTMRAEPISELALLLKSPSAESALEIARNQRAFAADEQLREAQLALQIGERGIAEKHLREASLLRPLDPVANEWLARVLLSKGRVKAAQEATLFADRAARIYGKTDQPLRAAASLILAARAVAGVDREQAQIYAENAVEQAGWYAQTHLELARQRAYADKLPESLESLRQAFYCHPLVLDNILCDPAFEAHKEGLSTFIKDIQSKIDTPAKNICASENTIAEIFGIDSSNDRSMITNPIVSRRIFSCRRSIQRQFREIHVHACEFLNASKLNSISPTPNSTYVLDAGKLTLNGRNTLEIITYPRVGDVISAGQPVLKYRLSNSSMTHIWKAPTTLEILNVSKIHGGAFTAMDQILTWTPCSASASAYQHRVEEKNYRNSLAKQNEAHSLLMDKEKKQSIFQKLAIGITGISWICVLPWIPSTPVRVLAAIMGVIAIVQAFKAWNALKDIRPQLKQSDLYISNLHNQILDLEGKIETIARRAAELKNRLQAAILTFEQQALSMFSVAMPFTALRSARVGDWVIVELNSIESYAAKMGLYVTFREEDFFPTTSNLALFRVYQKSGNEIKLTRAGAYLP
ncbi:tetratricopeptide repeat protein [Undibacterium rugosum]|uniref:tetratricopeptide repeat protein n=1 Tax=Undibacterium rugosum TaxID=2762291 RepID=UPI001B832D0E|nr:DUF4062 domain-containing protein [Undibacterium rugosum]MBR7780269.1 DUF4062 domain-containing protein [Undibacterium rugosum]